MKKNQFHILLFTSFLLSLVLIFACEESRIGDLSEWSPEIQENGYELSDIEREGDIPAINNPQFTIASAVDFLLDTSRVIGIKIGGIRRAYPIEIMDWHEIVNDQIDSIPVAITYSALTGSSIAFFRKINGIIIEFGVSGLLLNANTIMSDFDTVTDWSQFKRKGVKGNFQDTLMESIPVFEMNWQEWKKLFPNSEVMNYQTGFNRPYGTYPYGNYLADTSEYFFTLPDNLKDLADKFHLKEKILGVKVGTMVKGYRLKQFSDTQTSILEDEIGGEPVIIIGSQASSFMVAYSRKTNEGKMLNFTLQETDNSILLLDNEGNQWSIFGASIENDGQLLQQVESNIAFRFTWETFYENIEIID